MESLIAMVIYLILFSGFILWLTIANMMSVRDIKAQVANIILSMQSDPAAREHLEAQGLVMPPYLTLDDVVSGVWQKLRDYDRADLPKQPNSSTWGEL